MPHPRPLSPHLQIYRPQLTSVLSILHRFSGIALVFGLVMLTYFLTAVAMGPETYAMFAGFCASPLGTLMLMGWSFAACFHLCMGIRHLIFDTGRMMTIRHAYIAGYTAIAASVFLTTLLWLCVFGSQGGTP